MVFVLDANKRPQPMVHPAVARKLLRDGKAAVFKRQPFTIIRKDAMTKQEISYRIKIDYGSRHTGICILDRERVLWLAQIEHRTDIRGVIEKRRNYRRRRRCMNLRYRKARFNHRTRTEKWLPPSLMSRVNNVMTWVIRLCRIAPINSVSYENV